MKSFGELFRKYLAFVFIVAEGQTAYIPGIEETISQIPEDVLPQSPAVEEYGRVVDWLMYKRHFAGYSEGDLFEECSRAFYFAKKDFLEEG